MNMWCTFMIGLVLLFMVTGCAAASVTVLVNDQGQVQECWLMPSLLQQALWEQVHDHCVRIWERRGYKVVPEQNDAVAH